MKKTREGHGTERKRDRDGWVQSTILQGYVGYILGQAQACVGSLLSGIEFHMLRCSDLAFPWQVLGVDKGAKPQEIKKAFHK